MATYLMRGRLADESGWVTWEADEAPDLTGAQYEDGADAITDSTITVLRVLQSGGASLPTASGANEFPASTGAGTTYTARTAAQTRTALSLGGAALLAVGTGSNTVAAGDDSRLSNARTPTAHKSSHATGGSDVLSPSDIAALPRPPYVLPTGLGANDVLVIVPDSATEGSTTFTDLALGRTLTSTGAYHSTLRRLLNRSVMKLLSTGVGGSTGRLTAAQSNDFDFGTGDFTLQCLATVLPTGTTQRLLAQGALEDGNKRWCWGFASDGRMNFAYQNSGTTDRYSTATLLAQTAGRPVLYEAGRASGTLRMFVDGAVVYSGTDSAALGVPISGSPAAADALIVGARNPSSPTEPASGLEIHFIRVVKGACLHTAAYDPTT